MGVTQSPQGASGSNDRMPLTINEHIDEFNRRWFRRLRDLLPKLKSRRNKMANDDSPGRTNLLSSRQRRRSSRPSRSPNSLGMRCKTKLANQVAESDSLKQAHQDWKDQTNSEGRIIDRETDQDVTPEKDDNGRYVVLDKDGKPVGSYDDLDMAKDAWRTPTNTEGTIIDMKTKTDVTPEKQYSTKLDHQQLATALQMARGASAVWGQRPQGQVDVVAKYIKQLNRMKIPAYDIVNLRGRGRNTPTKTVPIVRREVTIETVRRQVEVERKGTPAKSRWLFVSHPTDDFEPTPVSGFRDIGKVRARDTHPGLTSKRS